MLKVTAFVVKCPDSGVFETLDMLIESNEIKVILQEADEEIPIQVVSIEFHCAICGNKHVAVLDSEVP